jgi:hypothetical protein
MGSSTGWAGNCQIFVFISPCMLIVGDPRMRVQTRSTAAKQDASHLIKLAAIEEPDVDIYQYAASEALNTSS